MNILVVESENSSLEKMKAFVRLGHEVNFCQSSQEALGAVAAMAAIDLVLINIDDPLLKGREVLAAVAKKCKDAKPQLISLGVSPEGRGISFDHILQKPLNNRELLELVEKIASDKKHASQGAAKAFDKNVALRICDGDEDLLREIVGIFQHDSLGIMQNLKEALMKNDLHGVETAAHTLKGAAGNICATAVRERAFVVERAAKNKNLEQSRQAFILLIQDYKELIRTLGKELPKK